jgi:hypothetical protein
MRRFIKDFKLELEVFVFLIGIILFIIGITGSVMPDSSPDFLKSVHRDLGGWVYWCALIGILMMVVGGWYMIDNIRKRREFEKLINTDSKVKFVKNQERIEFLAWVLTSDHERRLWEKKKKFGIKH